MENPHNDRVQRINNLTNDLDGLYHRVSKALGVSDSIMCVLYALHEKGGSALLYDIRRESGASKQTINSALRKLENDGMIFLEADSGKTKRACLTEKGRAYAGETAALMYEAECRAFDGWTDQEISQYLGFIEKYITSFRREVEKIERRTP